MLKIGVQSAVWYKKDDPDGSFAFIKSCGFEATDFNIDHYLSTGALAKSPDAPHSFFDKSIEELRRYIDTLNAEAVAEAFGHCFDVGHANMLRTTSTRISPRKKPTRVWFLHHSSPPA